MENETEVGGSVDRRGLASLAYCLVVEEETGYLFQKRARRGRGGRLLHYQVLREDRGGGGTCLRKLVRRRPTRGGRGEPCVSQLAQTSLRSVVASQHTYVHTLTLLIRTTLETERKGAFSPRPLAESPVT